MYGIYIHIPFCISKCKYCDFASSCETEDTQTKYLDKLIGEIKSRSRVTADTVYIGGGTPTVLSTHNINRLLKAIRENFIIKENAEFTVEANPGTVTGQKAVLMKDYGVNRISMGAQTFLNDELRCLGRIHTAEDTVKTYELLREKGFENINLDLMYALPGQTMESYLYSLKRITDLRPEHISCYGLKIEEGTPFYKMAENGEITECDEDLFADMYLKTDEILDASGYEHYEISNFSLPGYESRHNLKYWQDGDYIGFGVAASSREGNRRYTNPLTIRDYINGEPLSEDITMNIEEQMREFIILGLRVIKTGADKEKFKAKFGVDPDAVFEGAIQKVRGSTINTPTSIKLRKEALLVSNSVMCEFMG